MNRFIKSFLLLIPLFVLFPRAVFAVDVSISSYPSTITSDPFDVTISISGANDGVNYLRVDLYKEGSTNYFGETFNSSEWYSGSDGLKYYPVQIQNSTASAIVQARIGNPTASEYSGSGNYKLKIRRYTSSGSYTFGEPIDVQINYSTPSPEPTLSPTSSPTDKPKTPSPSPKPTSTPTSKPTPITTSTPKSTNTLSPNPEVLSESTNKDSETSSPEILINNTSSKKSSFPKVAVVIIISGIVLVTYAFYLAYKIQYNSKNETKI